MKSKIKIFSYINIFSKIIDKNSFDFLRIDLEEISFLNGFINEKIISTEYMINYFKNLSFDRSKIIFDLPYDCVCYFDKINLFLFELNINNISVSLEIVNSNLLNYLKNCGVKLFFFFNKSGKNNFDANELVEKIKLVENIENTVLILENFTLDELTFLKNKTKCLILSNNNINKFDGFYLKNLEILGIMNENVRKLNFSKIYNETIQEIVFDSNK